MRFKKRLNGTRVIYVDEINGQFYPYVYDEDSRQAKTKLGWEGYVSNGRSESSIRYVSKPRASMKEALFFSVASVALKDIRRGEDRCDCGRDLTFSGDVTQYLGCECGALYDGLGTRHSAPDEEVDVIDRFSEYLSE